MPALTSDQLTAIASLWKKRGQTLVAAFGGTSMLPTIAPGERVTIRCGESGNLGNVLVVIWQSTPIVHRIIAVGPNGSWILTRGDNNLIPDVPVRNADLIVGRVISVPAWTDTYAQRVVCGFCRAAMRLPRSMGDRLIRLLIRLRRLSNAVLLRVALATNRAPKQ